MKKILRVLWLISGILLILAGVYCLFNPGAALVSIAYLVGISVLFDGISSLILFFAAHRELSGPGWILFDGIISTVMGILLLFTNLFAFVATALPWIFAVWVILKGIVAFLHSFDLKKLGGPFWYILTIIGVLCAIFGVVSMIRPIVGAIALSIIIGIYLIGTGISTIAGWSISGKAERFFNELRDDFEGMDR